MLKVARKSVGAKIEEEGGGVEEETHSEVCGVWSAESEDRARARRREDVQ